MVARIFNKYLMIAISIAISFNAILPYRVSSAQESTELAFILSRNPIRSVPRADRAGAHSDLSRAQGVKLLLIGAIRLYQKFISPQDVPTCNFVPGCSQFGVEAIGQLGVLRGILLTSDRLQRCNSMSTSRYQMDYKSGELIDPVRIYAEILP